MSSSLSHRFSSYSSYFPLSRWPPKTVCSSVSHPVVRPHLSDKRQQKVVSCSGTGHALYSQLTWPPNPLGFGRHPQSTPPKAVP